MNDLLSDACRWHVDAEAVQFKERAFENFRDHYTVLLEFLSSNGLLREPLPLQKIDWSSFEFRQSQLTEEGFALVKLCHGTWAPAFGHALTQRHMTQWKRKLSKMRLVA